MSEIITSITEGYWGRWGGVVTAPVGCYINGIRVRYEAPVGSGDDTALNGIEIQYVSLPGAASPVKKTVVVHPGYWGDWRKWVYVPDGYYIIGFIARLESSPYSHNDDTGLNGIRMICKNFFSDDIKRLLVEEGNWGNWNSTEVLAPHPGWGVVGLQVRLEVKQGSGDDTAMNGIRMVCRKLI